MALLPEHEDSQRLRRFMLSILPAVSFERKAETHQMLINEGIKFSLEPDTEQFIFYANPKTKVVTVGHKGLRQLWCRAYAAFVHFDEIIKAMRADPTRRHNDLRNTERGRLGSDLLKWATEHDLDAALQGSKFRADQHPFPSHLPQPFADSGSDEDMAGELSYVALAWIIHHEITHILRQHVKCSGDPAKQQEYEADDLAAEWLLGDTKAINAKQREKRLLGIALAMVYLTAFEVYLGVQDDGEHPPSHDRLLKVLDKFEPDPTGHVWWFVMVLLGVDMQNRPNKLDHGKAHQTPRDCVGYYVQQIDQLDPVTLHPTP